VQQALAARNIITGIHYPIPVHMQPAFGNLSRYIGLLPQTEKAAQEQLSLPMFAELTHQQIREVASAIIACFDI
jgi:dTDP-4-amino-4,6-dideoxygalactose transaminase